MLISSGQWMVFSFIILEFSLVFLFIALVFVAKFRVDRQNKTIKYLHVLFTDMLQKYSENNDLEPFKHVRRVGLLLYTARNSQILSQEQLAILVKEIILPIQIQYIDSRDWKKRYRLMNCFEHYIDNAHYHILIRLINDESHIIRVNASIIGSRLANNAVLQAILEQLLSEDRDGRLLYIYNFKANKAFESFLFGILEHSDKEYTRRVIYEILNVIGCSEDYFDVVSQDCFSGGESKQVAAIRCLSRINHAEVLKILKQLVSDDRWLIRNVVVRALGEVESEEAINLIGSMLHDQNWWVKSSAIKQLFLAGDMGQKRLAEMKIDIDNEIADYPRNLMTAANNSREKNA